MKTKTKTLDNAMLLRKKAEKLVRDKRSVNPHALSDIETTKLLHELEVHQIELEMQNEELQAAKIKAEAIAAKYTDLYDFAPVGYFTLDRNGDICELNLIGTSMLGSERSKLKNSNFMFFVSADTRPFFHDFINRIFTTQTPQSCEIQLCQKEKNTMFVHLDGIVSDNGRQCLLTIVDVSERIRAEDELRTSYEFNTKLLNIIPFGIKISDEKGKILFKNENFQKLFGQKALIKNCGHFYCDNHHDCSDCKLVSDTKGGNTKVYENKSVLNGKTIEISQTRVKFQGKTAIMEIFQDITERKQTELAIIAAKEHAEMSDRLKSAFLANMSHEIRTPMNGILGFAELLKDTNLTKSEERNYINIIGKSGARMLNIINDIINISKIEAGLMTLNLMQTNINEQIEFIYTFFKPEVEEKGMQLTYNNSLPDKKAILKTDPEKLYAVFTNLVKNAIKFSHQGEIEIGYVKKGDLLEFYVKDTGIGIPKDRQYAIFERFIQADITNISAYQGSGLGLSISKAYIEMLGGTIWVKSEKEKGSAFYFTLPYQTVIKKDKTTKKDSSRSVEVTPIKNLKILIVEDDAISEELISIDVRKFSRKIIHARTGIEAVLTCLDHPDIDLVLMDIQMPVMNGYEATKQIRMFNKDVIIIAQTALAFEGDKKKAMEAGCNDIITKPIKIDILQKKILKHLNKTTNQF